MIIWWILGLAIYVSGMFLGTYLIGRFDIDDDHAIAFTLLWPIGIPFAGLLYLGHRFYEKGKRARGKK